MAPPTSARRSTRVSRTSTGGTSTATTSSRRKGKNRQQHHTFTATKSDKPARKWTRVLRPPKPGVGFMTFKWVPVDQMTMVERNVYDEEELKKKKLKEMDVMVTTSIKQNSPKQEEVGARNKGDKGLEGKNVEEHDASSQLQKEVTTKEAGPFTEIEPSALRLTVKDKDFSSDNKSQQGVVAEKERKETPRQFNQSDEMGSIVQKSIIDEGAQSQQQSSHSKVTTKETNPESNEIGAAVSVCSVGATLQEKLVEEKSIVTIQTRHEEENIEMERKAKKARIDLEPEGHLPTIGQQSD